MRNILSIAMIMIFLVTGGAISTQAESPTVTLQNAPVQLTEKQKQELSVLHKDILAKKKEVISKYVEYGVIPKEKGERIISHMEERYTKLEQNGFIMRHETQHHRH